MTDQSDLPFACACGAVAGWIAQAGPHAGDHIVCYCTDCRRFATHFGAEERTLNAAGGTSLFQSRCARINLSTGRDRLACLHLTKKPTLRWYAACCNTPMFNTYANGRIPYITTLTANCDSGLRDKLLGPAIGHLSTRSATAAPGNIPRMSAAKLMWRVFPRMMIDVLAGDRRKSVLFHSDTLLPIAVPYRLNERQQNETSSAE